MKQKLDVNDILNSKVNLDEYVENFEDYKDAYKLYDRTKFSGKAKTYIHSLIPNNKELYFVKDYKAGYYCKVCAFRITKNDIEYSHADVENINGERKVYGHFVLKDPARNNYTKIIDNGWRKEETMYDRIDYVSFNVYDGWITSEEQERAKEIYQIHKQCYVEQKKREAETESKRIEEYNLRFDRDEYEELKKEFENDII